MSVKRVLVATDGSDEAAGAIDWLATFPLPSDVAVEVVSVAQLPFTAEAVAALGRRELRAQSEQVVDDARRRLAKRWPDVVARVLDGDPRRAIVDAATESGADLIVLGARGLGAVASFLLGSVSLGVTRYAPCPVLVCRGAARPVRGVTVALDGSSDAQAALDVFSALPLPPELRVRLVGVVAPVRRPSSAPAFLAPSLTMAAQQLENEARERLEAALAPAATALRSRVRNVVTATPTGAPAATILREAETDGSDLIVVGARGIGMVERVTLGSVSETILRQAACSVLVVRPRA
jgi:nucleotide-binding universal stress UspA family protein